MDADGIAGRWRLPRPGSTGGFCTFEAGFVGGGHLFAGGGDDQAGRAIFPAQEEGFGEGRVEFPDFLDEPAEALVDDLLGVLHQRLDEGEGLGRSAIGLDEPEHGDGGGAALEAVGGGPPVAESGGLEAPCFEQRRQEFSAEHIGVGPVADASVEPGSEGGQGGGGDLIPVGFDEQDGNSTFFILAALEERAARFEQTGEAEGGIGGSPGFELCGEDGVALVEEALGVVALSEVAGPFAGLLGPGVGTAVVADGGDESGGGGHSDGRVTRRRGQAQGGNRRGMIR